MSENKFVSFTPTAGPLYERYYRHSLPVGALQVSITCAEGRWPEEQVEREEMVEFLELIIRQIRRGNRAPIESESP